MQMLVVDVMSSAPHSCSHYDTLAKAAQIMWERDCGALPVLNETGDPIAMITDRDICMATLLQGKPLIEIPVMSAASRDLTYITPEDSVDRALALMAEHHVRRLPVVGRARNLIGIVSLIDIVRSRCEAAPADTKPEFKEIAKSLVALCSRST